MKRAFFVLLLASCGAVDEGSADVRFVIGTPQALVACAAPPAVDDVFARLWISGSAEPCPLQVDDDGVSGTCPVVAGIERTFTLDWFMVDGSGVEVVLAQARTSLDLDGTTDADAIVAFDGADYVVSDCLDLRAGNGRDGAVTIVVDGSARPVCDLDDDGVANLEQLCAGRDPLGRL